MRTNCTARRPDLMLEDTGNRTITLVDTVCPTEANKDINREEKTRKYQQLCFELRERRGYKVKVTPTVIGCLGGGLKELKANIKSIFDNDNNNKHSALAQKCKRQYCGRADP